MKVIDSFNAGSTGVQGMNALRLIEEMVSERVVLQRSDNLPAWLRE
jgi:hypothetical protein